METDTYYKRRSWNCKLHVDNLRDDQYENLITRCDNLHKQMKTFDSTMKVKSQFFGTRNYDLR